MKRLRTLLELGLASGATIGILALTLPRFLGGAVDVQQPTGKPPALGSDAAATVSEQGLSIAHFLGIAQFVKSPTEYSIICGAACDFADQAVTGEVVSASLEGDRMEIEYRYLTAGKANMGKLIGTLNSDGVFAGTYRIGDQAASRQGDITFTFAADGSAKGRADKGRGAVEIIL